MTSAGAGTRAFRPGVNLSDSKRPSNSIPTGDALALLAAYMNSDRAKDVPEAVKNGLADMAADFERHKRDELLREKAAYIDAETLRHIIENPVMPVPTKGPERNGTCRLSEVSPRPALPSREIQDPPRQDFTFLSMR